MDASESFSAPRRWRKGSIRPLLWGWDTFGLSLKGKKRFAVTVEKLPNPEVQNICMFKPSMFNCDMHAWDKLSLWNVPTSKNQNTQSMDSTVSPGTTGITSLILCLYYIHKVRIIKTWCSTVTKDLCREVQMFFLSLGWISVKHFSQHFR